MSSTDNIKNKLVNSMKLTKQGTAKTTTASEKKEEPVAVKKASAPTKPAASTVYMSSCRVWPD